MTSGQKESEASSSVVKGLLRFRPATDLIAWASTYTRDYLVADFVESKGDLQAHAGVAAGNEHVTFVTGLVLVAGVPGLPHQIGQQSGYYRAQCQYL